MIDIKSLRVGDHLLYRPNNWAGWLIAIKTWTRISHCEVYAGEGQSLASRDGIGVNRYAFRYNNLARVLRPNQTYDWGKAEEWFETVKGQKYDLPGLLIFFLAVRRTTRNRMFCSNFLLRLDRKAGFNPVPTDKDADRMAPAEFLDSLAFDRIWSDGHGI